MWHVLYNVCLYFDLEVRTNKLDKSCLSVEVMASVCVTVFIVAAVMGFLLGLIAMYTCVQKKPLHLPTERHIQPTVPSCPVYEEVSSMPKEEIELKTNQAYGPVGH